MQAKPSVNPSFLCNAPWLWVLPRCCLSVSNFPRARGDWRMTAICKAWPFVIEGGCLLSADVLRPPAASESHFRPMLEKRPRSLMSPKREVLVVCIEVVAGRRSAPARALLPRAGFGFRCFGFAQITPARQCIRNTLTAVRLAS